MRVSTQLTDAGDGLVLWSESYEREVKDVFAVQDDIARAIVTALRVTLTGGTPAATADRGTSDLEAYDLYLRGMYFYQRRGASLPIAVESFSKAIAKDSGFARAYAGLSMALTGLTVYTNSPAGSVLPPALVAAERATALDPALAEAFLATGIAQFFSYRWSETEAAFRRAIVLDSTLALARLWYGRFLYAVGRIDEGVLQLERAKALDPLSAANAASLAYGLSLADRHSDAIADARRALEIDSLLLPAQTNLLLALVNGGRLPEARAAAERILRSPTDITVQGMAAYAFGMAGDRPRAAALAGEIIRNHAGEWRVQTAALRAFLGAGDTAQALTAMERAVAAGEPFVINLSLVDHLYDSVRGSARFAALVRRVGLEERLFLQRRER
jgi:serine/threonine-protein kinase